MLKNNIWQKIKNSIDRRKDWFQQDGVTPHTAISVCQWLAFKFGENVISRFAVNPRSLGLSPLNFWFWSVFLAELRK